jgi:HEAT repeat protein
MTDFKNLVNVLEAGSKEEKIKFLESLSNSKDPEIIQLIISKLDDPEIEVRGEAFSSLVLNENNISEFLKEGLLSENKNVRGFSALVLANRQNSEGIQSIILLTKDESSLVRACALGALGYLKAHQASKAIRSCFSDSNLEVKKSALKAAIDIGEKLPLEEINELKKENDSELDKLLVLAKENS